MRTGSGCPAVFQVRNLTVFVAGTENGAVYRVELVVGSVPSSV